MSVSKLKMLLARSTGATRRYLMRLGTVEKTTRRGFEIGASRRGWRGSPRAAPDRGGDGKPDTAPRRPASAGGRHETARTSATSTKGRCADLAKQHRTRPRAKALEIATERALHD